AIAYPRTSYGEAEEASPSLRPLGPSWGDDVLAPERPSLYLVPPAAPRSRARRRPSTRVYRRRRFVVGLLVAAVLLTAGAVLGRLGGGPLTAPETAPTHAAATAAPAPRLIHVVQPGDTLWVIARALQPTGDVRPLVDKLEASRHGQPLRVGEVITLP
ncbi:MAG: LysM peptidoglycan-binding domain-containing protein, partial [Actinobacteria bacterium]|nr:LysM peptidoglycan-binding domain-containing protein [Actinomycetota bacterium]